MVQSLQIQWLRNQFDQCHWHRTGYDLPNHMNHTNLKRQLNWGNCHFLVCKNKIWVIPVNLAHVQFALQTYKGQTKHEYADPLHEMNCKHLVKPNLECRQSPTVSQLTCHICIPSLHFAVDHRLDQLLLPATNSIEKCNTYVSSKQQDQKAIIYAYIIAFN